MGVGIISSLRASIMGGSKSAKCSSGGEMKQAVNLHLAWTQEPKNFVREASGPYILIINS